MIENKITEEFLRQLRFTIKDNGKYVYKCLGCNKFEIEFDPNNDGKLTLIERKNNKPIIREERYTSNNLLLFFERYRDLLELIIDRMELNTCE